MNRPIATAALLAALTAVASAHAQAPNEDLRAKQEALFDQLLEEPDNLELMFDHALTSLELGDLEAAISTLERMLIFNPALGRAKVELGAAYFRLGAYENARYYFEDVLENDSPPDEVVARVNGFLDEINRRTQTSGFNAIATVGATYNTNASLGPGDSDVLLFGLPAQLGDEFLSDDDVGIRAAFYGSHFYDLDQPDGDVWRTDLNLFSIHYLEETRGDIDSFALRTGPRLSIDNRSFGPKIRPFLEVDHLRADNDALYSTFGGGAEFTNSISERVNIFGVVQGAYRDYYNGRDGFDGPTARAAAGVAYAVDRQTALRGQVFVETDQADDDINSNFELGARISAVMNYESGFEMSDRLWSISGYVQGAYRDFEDANPSIDPNRARRDYDLRLGVSHVFHFTGGWFAQADADYLVRDSNLPNFDLDTLGVTVSVGRSF